MTNDIKRFLLLSVAGFCLAATPVRAQTTYVCTLNGASEVPSNASAATGSATVILNAAQTQLSISCSFQNLVGTYTASHIHAPAAPGFNAGVRFGFVGAPAGWVFSNGNHDGVLTNFIATGVTATDVANLANGLAYINVHSTTFPGGEIRGQLAEAQVPVQNTTWGHIKALYR